MLARDPTNADALHLLGMLTFQLGRHDAADYVRRAIEIDPAKASYHDTLGSLLQASDALDEAIGCFQSALALAPDAADVHYNLGNAYRTRGDVDPASESYLAALRLRPTFVEAHNNLGLVRQSQGKLDEAIDCFERALRLRPGDRLVQYDLAAARLLAASSTRDGPAMNCGSC